MKIVNKSNIPDAIYQFMKQDFYGNEAKGTLSATTLLKPIQEIVLTERHWDDIEIEASGRLWSIFGSGVHAVLEKLKGKDEAPIERLFLDLMGERISGKYDRIHNNMVWDYKVTSAWTIAFDSRNTEWKQQLSIYRWLYYKAKGIELEDTGKIIAILRDWSEKNLASLSSTYPESPAMEIDIPLLSLSQTEAFVTNKIKAIQEARLVPFDLLPKCTDEERWYNAKKKTYIKCDKYCQVSQFCHQKAKEVKCAGK